MDTFKEDVRRRIGHPNRDAGRTGTGAYDSLIETAAAATCSVGFDESKT